jgi:hypothetical protein
VAAVVIGAALSLVVTSGARWQISLQVAGNAGAVTVLPLLFGWPALVLVPLVPRVGWARWQVRAHTVARVVAAVLIAVAVTVANFWLFGVL